MWRSHRLTTPDSALWLPVIQAMSNAESLQRYVLTFIQMLHVSQAWKTPRCRVRLVPRELLHLRWRRWMTGTLAWWAWFGPHSSLNYWRILSELCRCMGSIMMDSCSCQIRRDPVMLREYSEEPYWLHWFRMMSLVWPRCQHTLMPPSSGERAAKEHCWICYAVADPLQIWCTQLTIHVFRQSTQIWNFNHFYSPFKDPAVAHSKSYQDQVWIARVLA